MKQLITQNLIVGAGPAGSACALALLKAGRECVLVDKSAFPRVKLCAGVLTGKSQLCLQELLGPKAYGQLMGASLVAREPRLRLWRRTHCLVDVDLRHVTDHHDLLGDSDCTIHEVDRPQFDLTLVRLFQQRGGKFIDGDGLRDIDTDRRVATLASGTTIGYQHLIAADGAASHAERLIAARDKNFTPKGRNSIALEINVSREDLDLDGINIYFDFIPHTYAWAFSKGPQVCLGICRMADVEQDPKEAMRQFLSALGLKHPERYPLVGAPIPLTNTMKRPLWHDEVYFVGDAAGLNEPMTGEGIYYALQSGVDAAEAIALNRPDAYLKSNRYLQRLINKGARYQQLFNHRLTMAGFQHLAERHNRFVGYFYLTQIEQASLQRLPQIVARYPRKH